MVTNGTNGNGGRHKIEIDWKQFEAYCAVQCTLREIADNFNCSERTLEDKVKEHYNLRFCDIFKRKRQKGLMSLRANLFRMSEKQPSVAIFLAKNWLGMTDKVEIGNPEGESFRVEHDGKSRLLSMFDSLAARRRETQETEQADGAGS